MSTVRPSAASLPGLRVAQIGPVPPSLGGVTPGGVATHQEHLAAALGHLDVSVDLLATNAPAARPAAALERPDGYTLHRPYRPSGAADWLAPAYLRGVRPGILARYAVLLTRRWPGLSGSRRAALADLLAYRRFLAMVRPGLVHVQHPLERHLYARLVLAWERWRIPLVVTVHSLFDEHPDHTIRGLMAPNLQHAARLIAVSPHVAEQAVQLGAPRERIRVIRSGVDVERFHPRDRGAARTALGLDTETPIALFVGNLEPRKAVDRLLTAFPTALERCSSARLVLVGTGESAGADNQEPRLRQMVRDLGLGPVVRFEGRVSDEALERWYAAADVFVLPSSSEAQGLVALEAMASGLPVVASAVGGLVGTVEDGVSGYLVPFGVTDLLADRIASLLADPARRRSVAAAGRQVVVERFSWAQAAAATCEVYREALAA